MALAQAGLGERAARIVLLAYPRVFGYVFNPLAVYFAYDVQDRLIAAIYAVRNTFGERHTYVAPVAPGDFVLSDRIACFEGTSRSYVDDVEAQRADAGLNRAVATAVAAGDAQLHTGTFATFDAFYRDMFALDAPTQARVDANRAMLAERGVVAADMETSALVNAAAALDVRFTSLCVGTVDGVTRAKLEPEAMAAAEHRLFTTALSAITSL